MAGNVRERLATKLLLLIAGCACLHLLQRTPQSFDELSKKFQEEFNLPTTTRLQNVTKNVGYRRFIVRRWEAWKQASVGTSRSCHEAIVMFDQAPQHGCIIDANTSIPFCRMKQLRIDVSEIEASIGGEELESVMGRVEDVEYPKYQPGSLTVSTPLKGVPSVMERPTFHYIQDVLSAVTLEQRQLPCGETWTGTTLFLTRYEYVNLYHTMTDFFNTFLSYPIVDHDNEQQVNVVFLDGHAKGNLDSVWRQVFGKTAYVKHLPEGGVCFNRVVFIPPGYVAPFYPKTFRSVCPNPIMMEDFANHFLTSFNLDHVQMQRGKIVIIDRVPYISHPRSKPHRAERTVNNMNELPARLRKLPNVESVSVVHFEELTFKQQLKAVREAHILIGNHGAGLTHMVFMSDGSHVVEFDGRQPFFTALSGWKPHVGHHVIRSVSGHLSEEYIQRILIPTLEKILR